LVNTPLHQGLTHTLNGVDRGAVAHGVTRRSRHGHGGIMRPLTRVPLNACIGQVVAHHIQIGAVRQQTVAANMQCAEGTPKRHTLCAFIEEMTGLELLGISTITHTAAQNLVQQTQSRTG
jgi:hypothetical protein